MKASVLWGLAFVLLAASPLLAVTQDEVEAIAWTYTELKWVSPVTYDPPQNSGLVFVKGKTYTGEAYWYGGNDTPSSFLSKMSSSGYVPRKNAGIDCSAFVSRCWKTSRHTTATIPGIAPKIAWDAVVKGDVFNIPYSHVMLFHYRATSGAYVVWEAAGSPNQAVHRTHPASYVWTYVPRRYSGLAVTHTPGAAPPPPVYTPPPSDETAVSTGLMVTASVLNVRNGASTGNAILGQITKGQRYVAVAKKGAWYKIWFGGGIGWCHGAYVSTVSGAHVATVKASSLNVRKGPGTSHAVIGSVKDGQKYVVEMTSAGWALIYYDGRTGWVFDDYVTLAHL